MSDNLKRYRAIKEGIFQLYPKQVSGHLAQSLTVLAMMVVNTLCVYAGLVYAGFPMNNWFAIFLSLLGGISATVQGGRIIVKSLRLAEQERSKTKDQESIITQSER